MDKNKELVEDSYQKFEKKLGSLDDEKRALFLDYQKKIDEVRLKKIRQQINDKKYD